VAAHRVQPFLAGAFPASRSGAMTKKLNSFLRDTSGATSIEYGMIAILISVAILIGLTSISGSVGEMYALIVGAF